MLRVVPLRISPLGLGLSKVIHPLSFQPSPPHLPFHSSPFLFKSNVSPLPSPLPLSPPSPSVSSPPFISLRRLLLSLGISIGVVSLGTFASQHFQPTVNCEGQMTLRGEGEEGNFQENSPLKEDSPSSPVKRVKFPFSSELIQNEREKDTFWFKLKMTLKTLIRLPVLFALYFPLLLCYPILPSPTWHSLFLNIMDMSGPVFIKFAQWASTRPDIFPPKFIETFGKLQSHAYPHSFEYSQKVLSECFPGGVIGHLEISLSPHLIGSGSMAQVHQGKITNLQTGDIQTVAVKILHPNVHQHIAIDNWILYIGASLITSLPLLHLEFFSLPEAVEEFSSFIGNHTDLRIEAANINKFCDNFSGNKWRRIHFPRPTMEFVDRRILTESFEGGIPLGEFLTDCTNMTFNRNLAKLGMSMFLKMLIDDNFIHSDLHPGNLLVDLSEESLGMAMLRGELTDPKDPRQIQRLINESTHITPKDLKLRVLDCGLVTTLSQRNRRNFLSLFAALVEGDGDLAARLMKDHAREQHVQDDSAYRKEMRDLVALVPHIVVNRLTLGSLLQRVMGIIRKHRVKLESEFSSLVVSLIILEGIGRRLDPNLSIVTQSAPKLLANAEVRNTLRSQCGIDTVTNLIHMVTKALTESRQIPIDSLGNGGGEESAEDKIHSDVLTLNAAEKKHKKQREGEREREITEEMTGR